jgi:hypothetical protein
MYSEDKYMFFLVNVYLDAYFMCENVPVLRNVPSNIYYNV